MYDPATLRPLGSQVLVRMDPYPTERAGMEIPDVAVKKIPCKDCNGWGCFVEKIFEEDGIKLSRHRETPCSRCGGSGYKGRAYSPREIAQERWATVIKVGPGRQNRVTEFSTGRVLKWLDGREVTDDIKPGDKVLVTRYAGRSGQSWFLDDEETGLLMIPYGECVMAVPQGTPVPEIEALPVYF